MLHRKQPKTMSYRKQQKTMSNRKQPKTMSWGSKVRFIPISSFAISPPTPITNSYKLPSRLTWALGYYVASKLPFFAPGQIQGISCRGGYYLAVRCLPLNITNRYFILREWVHQYNGRGVSASVQRPRAGAIDLVRVSRKSIVGTAASVHRSKAVGVVC
jgi:hypothetical protein